MQIMKKSAHILFCGLVIVLSGCSTSLSQSDIIGTYQDNNPLATSTLVLNSDGTSSQVLTTKTGKEYKASGKWTFDSSNNQIHIDNGLSYDDLESPGRPRIEHGGMSCLVEKVFPEGTPQIVVDGDAGIAFNKIK